MKEILLNLRRYWLNCKRPSKRQNLAGLAIRGENTHSFIFRDATVQDIPALATVHVIAWADTYPYERRPPTYAIREYQWKEQFSKTDGSWFCIVIENNNGELIGFAKGIPFQKRIPGFDCELNKIYLLREYYRLGLGTRLFDIVTQRFISMGLNSMALFSEAANPTGYFYEAMGGERLYNKDGRFDGAYGWKELVKK